MSREPGSLLHTSDDKHLDVSPVCSMSQLPISTCSTASAEGPYKRRRMQGNLSLRSKHQNLTNDQR